MFKENKPLDFWATIDPGITGTGVCIWCKRNPTPVQSYSLKYRKVNLYMKQITRILQNHKVTDVVIEEVGFFTGSKGYAATKSGSTFKLARFIGSLETTLEHINIRHSLVKPIQWKGQLPKHITIKRIQELLPDLDISDKNDHEYDAIGIGLFILGRF